MLKYFALVVDLLEMEQYKDRYMSFAERMVPSLDFEYYFFHRHGFLFSGFLKLLRGEISPEVFAGIGDVESEFPLSDGQTVKDFEVILSNTKALEKLAGSVVVVDELMRGYSDNIDKLSIQYGFEVMWC